MCKIENKTRYLLRDAEIYKGKINKNILFFIITLISLKVSF